MGVPSISNTYLERFSCTSELLEKTQKWENDPKHTTLGPLGARTVGVIATPFTSIIDAIVHSILCVGKATTGVFFSFYNKCIATHLNPKYRAPRDLELSSALIHLSRVVDNLARAVILPVLMLLDPTRAYLLSQESSGKNIQTLHGMINKNTKEKINLQAKIQNLQNKLKVAEAKYNSKDDDFNYIISLQDGEIKRIVGEHEVLEKEVFDLRIKYREFVANYQLLKDQYNQLRDIEIPVLNNEISEKKKLLENALEGKVNDKTLLNNIDTLKAELKKKEEALRDLENKNKILEAELEKAQSLESDQIIEKLKKENENIRANHQHVVGINEDVQKKLLSANNAYKGLESDFYQLEFEKSQIEIQLSNNSELSKKEITELKKQIEELKSKEIELKRKESELSISIQKMSDTHKAELLKKDEMVKAKEEEFETLRKQFEEERKVYDEGQKDQIKLREELKIKETEIQAVRDTNELLKMSRNEEQDASNIQLQKLQEKEQQLENAEKELEKLKKELDSANNNYEDIVEANENLKLEKFTWVQHNAELSENLKKLEGSLEKANQKKFLEEIEGLKNDLKEQKEVSNLQYSVLAEQKRKLEEEVENLKKQLPDKNEQESQNLVSTDSPLLTEAIENTQEKEEPSVDENNNDHQEAPSLLPNALEDTQKKEESSVDEDDNLKQSSLLPNALTTSDEDVEKFEGQ